MDGAFEEFMMDDASRFATLQHLSSWFPEYDPANPKAQSKRTFLSKRQAVLRFCSVIAAIVFAFNLRATVAFKLKWKTIVDLGTIYHEYCTDRVYLVI